MRRQSGLSVKEENHRNHCSPRINYRKLLRKRVPITQWLPQYKLSSFFQDLLAGFTVSLTEIPQGIALAEVASLPAEHGLYSCLMGGVIYALFGTCKDLNIGPSSIMSVMTQPYVNKYGTNVGILLTFLTGVVTFLLGLFNLGFIIEYFSYPIIAGFTCAASLEIASIQLNNFFGVKSKADSFLEAWDEIVHSTDEIRLWDTVLGLISLLCLIVLREIKRFGTLRYRQDWSRSRNIIGIAAFVISIARNAIVILASMLVAYSLGKDVPFAVTGTVDGGFPPVQPPPFTSTKDGTTYSFTELISGLGTAIIFVPLVGILEAVSIAKTFANGKRIDATQEILALGLTNTAGSFIGAMPITGGFTRTAINNASGVQTTLGGVFTTLITVVAIAFLTPTFQYVPKPTMAAVIIAAMIYLFEYGAFALIWKNKKSDMIPFLVTLICCLTISLEYGILIGIVVNLLFLLYPAARPKILMTTEKVPKHHGDVIVVTPYDNLFFPAAENLRDRVLALEGDNLIIVIDGKYIRNIDITVARSLVVLTREITNRGQEVIFWHFKDSIMDVCAGLDENLKRCFRSGELEDVTQDFSFLGA